MDQARFAGIGNIYANDALFSAKIHPLRPASSLSDTDQRNLFEAIEHVLTEGIKAGGASEENFVNALGEKGFYPLSKVWDRKGICTFLTIIFS